MTPHQADQLTAALILAALTVGFLAGPILEWLT